MKPIPVDFHIGSLQIHTYGIGLALTFWFSLRYFEHRLRKNADTFQIAHKRVDLVNSEGELDGIAILL